MLHGHGSDYLVKGWQVSGTIFARSGFSYTVIDSGPIGFLAQNNNYFGNLYAVPVGPITTNGSSGTGAVIPAAPNPCLPPQVLADKTPNPNAVFVQVSCETGFNAGNLPGPSGPCGGATVSLAQGRNRFQGAGYFNTDFAIMKNTTIPPWESASLGIGFQFFVFNHPNFGTPDNSIADPTYGELTRTVGPPTSILGSGLGGDVSPQMIQIGSAAPVLSRNGKAGDLETHSGLRRYTAATNPLFPSDE